MARILKLVFLLIISQVALGQAPSNYTNINGRYRWIAGMFDSTFSLPKGTTPSLRTGGSTNAGALFYRTTDSTVKYWTGTQWLTLSDSTRFVPYVGATQDVDLDTWSLNAKSLHVKGTGGNGHLGLKFQSATPNMSANESGVYADASGNLGVKIDNFYTSIFKTSLNSADRTYTLQNKNYTIADSADVAAKVGGTGELGYFSKWATTNTIDTSQMYQTSGRIGIGTVSPNAGYKLDVNGNVRVGLGSTTTKLTINGNTGVGAGGYLNFQKNSSNIGDIGPYSAVIGGSSANDMTFASNAGFYFAPTNTLGMVLSSGGNLGIGSGLATDSMLTVQNGAYFQRGVRMSGLPTGAGTKSLRVNANGTLSIADTLTNGISGSGTTNYIPKFTSSSAIGNSVIYESSGGSIGIGTITPAYKLDVSGTARANGMTLYGFATGTSGGNLEMGFDGSQGVLQAIDRSATWIPLYLAGSNITFNPSGTEKMRLTSTGLGIGTTVVTAPLTVAGTSDLAWSASTSKLQISRSGSVARLQNYDNGSASSLALQWDGGNVGIGTTSPLYTLDVNGTGRFSGNVTINGTIIGTDQTFGGAYRTFAFGVNSNSYNRIFATTDATDGIYINAATGQGVNFRVNGGGANVMTIDASGNLGLGTSSPATKLQVYQSGQSIARFGATNYTNINQDGIDTYAGGLAGTMYLNYYSGGAIDFLNGKMLLNTSGNLGLGVTPSAWASGGGNLQLKGGVNISYSNENGYLAANQYWNGSSNIYIANGYATQYAQEAGVHKWKIATSGTAGSAISFTQAMTLASTGNLLVGTTTDAGYKLDVAGSLRTTSTTVLGYNTTVGNASFSWGFPGSYFGQMQNVSGTVYGLGFGSGTSTNGTTVLSYNTSGNVGIGTTSPTESLDVNGNILSRNTFILYNGTQKWQQLFSGTDWLLRYNDGSSWYNRLSITSGGNVVIGSDLSSEKLEVGGAIRVRVANTTTAKLLLNNTDTQLSIENNGGAMAFTTAGSTERMRITSGGNVGIGTSSPTYKLDVKGGNASTIRLDNDGSQYTQLVFERNTTSNTGADFLLDGTNGTFGIRTLAAYPLTFSTSSSAGSPTERMRITSAGELLVNTTSDAGDYKLQVNGNGYFNGVAGLFGLKVVNSSQAGLIMSYTGTGANDVSVSNYNDTYSVYDETNARSILKTTLSTRLTEFGGSIKTAAPSGGTAKPYKWGEAGVAIGGSNGYAVKVEIDGTLYYLMTGYLPEPEPEAASGPTMGYKTQFEEPVIKIKSDNQKIKDLEKEIAELKELIKSKIK